MNSIWRLSLMCNVCWSFIFTCQGMSSLSHMFVATANTFFKRRRVYFLFRTKRTLLLAKRVVLSSSHDRLWLFAFSASAAIVCLWNYPRPNCFERFLGGWSFGLLQHRQWLAPRCYSSSIAGNSLAPRISARRWKNGGYFGWMSYTNFLSAMDIKDQT